MMASPICLRLFVHFMRAAASRTFWTAGRSRPMRMAMIAITTSSSMSVKPRPTPRISPGRRERERLMSRSLHEEETKTSTNNADYANVIAPSTPGQTGSFNQLQVFTSSGRRHHGRGDPGGRHLLGVGARRAEDDRDEHGRVAPPDSIVLPHGVLLLSAAARWRAA